MSIRKKLKSREVRWHFIAAFVMALFLLVFSLLFREYREWCHKGAEMCLASLLDFILFGGNE